MNQFLEKYLYDYRVILATGFSIAGIIFLASTLNPPQNTGLNGNTAEYKEVTRYREVEINFTQSEIDVENGLSMMITNTDERSGEFSISFNTCTDTENLTLDAGESELSPGEQGIFSVTNTRDLQRECTEALVDPPVKAVSYTEKIPVTP